jgi:hypothetical protein
VAVPLFFSATAVSAGFLAYNDLASSVPGEYAGTNVTEYSLGSTNELLKDFVSGATPGFRISVLGDGTNANVSGTTSNGANPAPGTDAYDIFDDYVNMVRYIQGDSGEGYVDLIFSNLLPSQRYRVAVYGERSPATDGRPTQFTISGADEFLNLSSVGANFGGPSDPATSYNTAPNDTNGYVALFDAINAGVDGTFQVRVDRPTGSQNWYVNAFSFGMVPVPAPLALIATGLLALGVLRGQRSRA